MLGGFKGARNLKYGLNKPGKKNTNAPAPALAAFSLDDDEADQSSIKSKKKPNKIKGEPQWTEALEQVKQHWMRFCRSMHFRYLYRFLTVTFYKC